MSKKKNELAIQSDMAIDENHIFECVSKIIENRKSRAEVFANSEVTLMF